MQASAKSRTVSILVYGLDPKIESLLSKSISGASIRPGELELEKMMEAASPAPDMIICLTSPPGVSLEEAGQMLRTVYPELSIYFLGHVSIQLDRKLLIKNGFTEVYFLPIDLELMIQQLKEKAAILGAQERVYRKVRLLDVKPDMVLEFNTFLYLPANGKHVRYSAAGDALDAQQVQKLKNHQVGSLSIPAEEMGSFYRYTADVLRTSAGDSSLSETERAEKLEESIRQVIIGMFTDQSTSTEEGKRSVKEMQGIVKSYVTAGATNGGSLYNRIQAAIAQGNNTYSHAAETSTLAALFAIALGLPTQEVEDIALAGMLHDLGLNSVPREVLDSPQSEWLDVDREIYQGHPEKSLSIIRDRKLVVSENIHRIILQHHEKFNGTGFPRGLAGDKIVRGAQILAIADELNERMAPKPGQTQMKPREVILKMIEDNGTSLTTQALNPQYLATIATLFEPPKE